MSRDWPSSTPVVTQESREAVVRENRVEGEVYEIVWPEGGRDAAELDGDVPVSEPIDRAASGLARKRSSVDSRLSRRNISLSEGRNQRPQPGRHAFGEVAGDLHLRIIGNLSDKRAVIEHD